MASDQTDEEFSFSNWQLLQGKWKANFTKSYNDCPSPIKPAKKIGVDFAFEAIGQWQYSQETKVNRFKLRIKQGKNKDLLKGWQTVDQFQFEFTKTFRSKFCGLKKTVFVPLGVDEETPNEANVNLIFDNYCYGRLICSVAYEALMRRKQ